MLRIDDVTLPYICYLSIYLSIFLSIYQSIFLGVAEVTSLILDIRIGDQPPLVNIFLLKKKFKILIVFKRWMPASKRCFFPTLTIFFLCCKLTSLLYKEIWGYSLCFWFVHRIQFKIGNATLCIKRGHLKLHRRPLSAKSTQNKWLNV